MAPTTTIELDPDTAKALATYAAALGMTVQDYLKKHFAGTNGPQTVDDADRWLDELAEGLGLPPLPRHFSTQDIYADHD
jgi:hypothetical protein